ncbi:DUF4349 domain-containing protein [Glycocaulis sp.]|uniref:DUF4349 domain-containing protein n=1 Tax=Glycocaulis sp. TaxID=1969725 RepID=UPI003D1B3505
MTTRLIATGWLAALLLAGCGDAGQEAGYRDGRDAVVESAPPAQMHEMGLASRAASPAPPPPPASGGQAAEEAALLAYRHTYGLRVPAAQLAGLHTAHQDACTAAGGNVCRVINASINDPDGERPSGSLEIRARPDWIANFRAGLGEEVSEAGGNIQSENTSVEDLTTQIVDGEARLAAQTALRDRLQGLLETADGPMSDILAVERELARVQADIDSRASVIAALRTRVETSRLTLHYHPIISQTSPVRFNPIMQALEDFTDTLSEGVAAVIVFIAVILPWLILLIPAVFLIRWLLVRRKRKKAVAKPS